VSDRGRRRFLAHASGTLLVGAVSRRAIPATSHRVTIEKMAFTPPVLEVERGESIEWHNADLVPHTVTNSAKRLDSGSIAPDATWTYTPTAAGEYSYVCTFHPTMRGVLRVR
jgi:plastocyanin